MIELYRTPDNPYWKQDRSTGRYPDLIVGGEYYYNTFLQTTAGYKKLYFKPEELMQYGMTRKQADEHIAFLMERDRILAEEAMQERRKQK